MKSAKECKDRFEDIVASVMGEFDPAAARELEEHLVVCDGCRAACEALKVEEKEVRSGFEAIAQPRADRAFQGDSPIFVGRKLGQSPQECVSAYPTTIFSKG